MNSQEATLAVMAALEAKQVPYMLVGSLASNFYGVARSTKDADFVVELGATSVQAVVSPLGPEFKLNPQITFESVTGTTRHIIDVPTVPFRIELFRLSTDAHDQERFQRRVRNDLPGTESHTFIPTAEDVIVTKLRWAIGAQRGKDRDDIRDVIAVQGDAIDWDYVHRWCDKHGTRETLDEIRAEIPPDID